MTTEQTIAQEAAAPTPATVAAQIAPRRLTQERIDRSVTEALRDAAKGLKPADYDEVKAGAERAAELERRITSLEGEISEARLDSLRISVAARFGVSEEDRVLLMTGADEATLTLQAERLGAPSRSMGNVARREGQVVREAGSREDREMNSFVNALMGRESTWDWA